MFKKLLVSGATAGLLLVSAGGAFATWNPWMPAPLPTTTVVNNGGIRNLSVNVANSGLNKSTGFFSSVTTGNATALQNTTNQLYTFSSCGGCSTVGGNTTLRNNGSVGNLSVNVANTGLNMGGFIHTGDAGAVQAVTNVINTGIGAVAN